jgi:hypothetical protein
MCSVVAAFSLALVRTGTFVYSAFFKSALSRSSGLTIIATGATPDDEREFGVEGGGRRSRKFLAA